MLSMQSFEGHCEPSSDQGWVRNCGSNRFGKGEELSGKHIEQHGYDVCPKLEIVFRLESVWMSKIGLCMKE